MTTCSSGKKGWPSKAAARRGVRSGRYGDRSSPAYQCAECHQWHVTSPAERGGHPRQFGPPAGTPRRQSMPVDAAFAELERMNRERLAR